MLLFGVNEKVSHSNVQRRRVSFWVLTVKQKKKLKIIPSVEWVTWLRIRKYVK